MITVWIDRENISLNMKGHAGYAEAGSDIVCAAASMLAYTMAARLREITQGDGLNISLSPGDAHISADASWQIISDCRAVIDTISAGFTLLAGQYPGHVSIEYSTV